MLKHLFNYSILGTALLACTSAFSATINFQERFTGSFSQIDDTSFYMLTSGEITYESVADSSNANCVVFVGCTGDATFLRDYGDNNTIFGTLTYLISNFRESTNFLFEVDYNGSLLITNGTGMYASATGSGVFAGTDFYTEFVEDESSAGNSVQGFNFVVNTPEVSEVPIPAAAWLFTTSLLGFAGWRRKINA